MYEHGMIAPVVVLAAWSLVMLLWLYLTRIPAMQRAKIRPGQASKAQMEALPGWATNPANNYNHLMEQPTIFYAIAFALQFLSEGEVHPINIGLAWTYVAIRVLHSLVQATVNIILIRFLIFSAGSLVLMALTFHALIAVGAVDISLPH